MRKYRTLLLAALSAALSAALTLAPPACAQVSGAGGDAPATAFGAGRMVQGTVTAIARDQITLKTEAGDLYTIAVTPNTQMRKDRAAVKLAEIHAGDGIGALGEVDRPNRTVHALMVYVVDAEQIRQARENLGKTYIAGKVTAINMDDLKLTVLRSDGKSQVIRVDEETSFKRGGGRGLGQALGFGAGSFGADAGGSRGEQGRTPGGDAQGTGAGESITLADIKVGDMVGGPGAVKGGTFLPTELSVATPGTRHRRDDGGRTPARAQEPQ